MANGGNIPQMDPNILNQTNITVADLESASTISCEKCGGVVWDHGFVMKKTSPMSKIGEHVVQLPVIFCKMCGTPFKDSCPVAI